MDVGKKMAGKKMGGQRGVAPKKTNSHDKIGAAFLRLPVSRAADGIPMMMSDRGDIALRAAESPIPLNQG